jgi:hypothetical protein
MMVHRFHDSVLVQSKRVSNGEPFLLRWELGAPRVCVQRLTGREITLKLCWVAGSKRPRPAIAFSPLSIPVARVLLWYAMIAATVIVPSCESNVRPGDDDNCPAVEINSSLFRAFYWGTDFGRTWEPNNGEPTGSVRFPTWISGSDIILASQRLKNGSVESGFFRLRLATFGQPLDLETHYESEWGIVSIEPYPVENHVLVLRAVGGHTQVELVHFDVDTMSVVKTVVDSSWFPLGIAAHSDESLIFYGSSPVNAKSGFYLRGPGEASEDMLLLEIALSPQVLTGISRTSGGGLLFGETSGVLHKAKASFFALEPGEIMYKTIATRDGEFLSIVESPVQPNLVLLNYDFFGDVSRTPQDHIEILDRATGQAIDLDVRTERLSCRYPGNNSAAWDPTGSWISFVAWYTDGTDGRISYSSLWLRRRSSDTKVCRAPLTDRSG